MHPVTGCSVSFPSDVEIQGCRRHPHTSEGGLGRPSWGQPQVIPLPDNGPPWEAAVGSNLTAQPPGPCSGDSPRGGSLPPHQALERPAGGSGRGYRRGTKPQTSHFTSLDPFSHLEYEVMKYSCLRGTFSLLLINFSLLSNTRGSDSTEFSYAPHPASP